MGPTELPEGLDGVSVCVGGGGEREGAREREDLRSTPEFVLSSWKDGVAFAQLGCWELQIGHTGLRCTLDIYGSFRLQKQSPSIMDI